MLGKTSVKQYQFNGENATLNNVKNPSWFTNATYNLQKIIWRIACFLF